MRRKGGLQIPPDKSAELGLFKQPIVSTWFFQWGRSVVHLKRNLTQKIFSTQSNFPCQHQKVSRYQRRITTAIFKYLRCTWVVDIVTGSDLCRPYFQYVRISFFLVRKKDDSYFEVRSKMYIRCTGKYKLKTETNQKVYIIDFYSKFHFTFKTPSFRESTMA